MEFTIYDGVREPYRKKDRVSDYARYLPFKQLEDLLKEKEEIESKIKKARERLQYNTDLEADLEADHSLFIAVIDLEKSKGINELRHFRVTPTKKFILAEKEYNRLYPFYKK